MTSQPSDLVLNTYRIVRTIGEGGMGTVYLGVDELSRPEVALKMVKFRIPQKTVRETFYPQRAQVSRDSGCDPSKASDPRRCCIHYDAHA